MRYRKKYACALMSSLAILICRNSTSQNYPSKPVRVLTAEAGGGADFATRIVAHGLTGALGQPVIVDNRGGGVIPPEIVSRAPPDGYTLLFLSGAFWQRQLLDAKTTPYNVQRDFAFVTLALSSPNVLVINPSVAASSVKELIALAKGRPGGLNYGSNPSGSTNHLAAELFKTMASVDVVRITYKGAGPALNDLVAGRVQVMFASAGSVTSHLKSGRLRALAVTSAQPSVLFPGLPTVAATLPGYEADVMIGLYTPAKTPAAIINRLNQDTVRVLATPEVKERFFNAGIATVGSSPAEHAAAVKSDMVRWEKVIKDANIQVD